MAPSDALLSSWFDAHKSFLWGLCYRITGSSADADDLVQETYMRALQHGPDRLDNPRTWLTRVAVNAARDALRRRKRRSYVGPWLPGPVETGDDTTPASPPPTDDEQTIEARYDEIESVSLAFLQAMEALTATQRAILLLCDVFDYSAAEAASVLNVSEVNARTIHHRARRAMESYRRRRALPTAANRQRTGETLRQFLALLDAGDVGGIERMLSDDVTAVADSGGAFSAARRPIVGVGPVAQFFVRLAVSRRERPRITLRSINGFPAADIEFDVTAGQRPPRLLLAIDVDPAGRIRTARVIASPRKLAALPRVAPSAVPAEP